MNAFVGFGNVIEVQVRATEKFVVLINCLIMMLGYFLRIPGPRKCILKEKKKKKDS